jgi:hypothetical protein
MSGKTDCCGGRADAGRCLLIMAIVSVLFAGCGHRSGRQGIEGTVTLDGKPLETGQIAFRPQQGTASPSGGADVRGGRFSIAPERGLLPGKFRVEITASRPGQEKVRDHFTGKLVTVEEQYLSARYNQQSQLEATVEASGPSRFEFVLTSK